MPDSTRDYCGEFGAGGRWLSSLSIIPFERCPRFRTCEIRAGTRRASAAQALGRSGIIRAATWGSASLHTSRGSAGSPGDVRVERPGFRLDAPLTTSISISWCCEPSNACNEPRRTELGAPSAPVAVSPRAAHAIRRGSAHPARQQCGRASAPRPRRRPQESLWVALAPWNRGRRRLLHALRNRPPGRRRSACISSACRLRGNRPTWAGYVS